MFVVVRIGRENRGTDYQRSTAKAMLRVALRVIPGGDGFHEAESGFLPGVGWTVKTESSTDERDDGAQH